MAVEDVTFSLRIEADPNMKLLQQVANGVEKLNQKFEKTNATAEKAEKSISKMAQSIKQAGQFVAAYFSFQALTQFGKSVVDVTANFQRFEAVLTNTLGSSSRAQRALKDIQKFAAVTPFGVAELTDAFVKLANQGFTPTIDELRKLGDLAASTGKTFDQLAEAILDAPQGQFIRLREFGIRADKAGNQVIFTFKGVKTAVDFSAEAINKYLIGLGHLQGVSGSMAAISLTLGGRISNLNDKFDEFKNTLGQGAAPALAKLIEGLTVFLDKAGGFIRWLEKVPKLVKENERGFKLLLAILTPIAAILATYIARMILLSAQKQILILRTNALAASQRILSAVLGTTAGKIGLVGAAAAAAAIAVKIYDEATKRATTFNSDFKDSIEAINNALEQALIPFNLLFKELSNTALTDEGRLRVIEEINAAAAQYGDLKLSELATEKEILRFRERLRNTIIFEQEREVTKARAEQLSAERAKNELRIRELLNDREEKAFFTEAERIKKMQAQIVHVQNLEKTIVNAEKNLADIEKQLGRGDIENERRQDLLKFQQQQQAAKKQAEADLNAFLVGEGKFTGTLAERAEKAIDSFRIGGKKASDVILGLTGRIDKAEKTFEGLSESAANAAKSTAIFFDIFGLSGKDITEAMGAFFSLNEEILRNETVVTSAATSLLEYSAVIPPTGTGAGKAAKEFKLMGDRIAADVKPIQDATRALQELLETMRENLDALKQNRTPATVLNFDIAAEKAKAKTAAELRLQEAKAKLRADKFEEAEQLRQRAADLIADKDEKGVPKFNRLAIERKLNAELLALEKNFDAQEAIIEVAHFNEMSKLEEAHYAKRLFELESFNKERRAAIKRADEGIVDATQETFIRVFNEDINTLRARRFAVKEQQDLDLRQEERFAEAQREIIDRSRKELAAALKAGIPADDPFIKALILQQEEAERQLRLSNERKLNITLTYNLRQREIETQFFEEELKRRREQEEALLKQFEETMGGLQKEADALQAFLNNPNITLTESSPQFALFKALNENFVKAFAIFKQNYFTFRDFYNTEEGKRLELDRSRAREQLRLARERLENAKNVSAEEKRLLQNEVSLRTTKLMEADQKYNKAQKEYNVQRVKNIAQFVGDSLSLIVDTYGKALQGEIEKNNQLIAKQRERVSEIKSALDQGGEAAKKYSATQLQLEEERLDKLQKLREADVDKQRAAAVIQVAINAAVAVAQAAAQGGTAAAITIPIVLAAMTLGLAVARSLGDSIATAEQGGVVGQGRLINARRSQRLGGRRHSAGGTLIEAEAGETIFSRAHSKAFQPLFDDILRGEIRSVKDMTKRSFFPQAAFEKIPKMNVVVNTSMDIRRLQSEFESLRGELKELRREVRNGQTVAVNISDAEVYSAVENRRRDKQRIQTRLNQ